MVLLSYRPIKLSGVLFKSSINNELLLLLMVLKICWTELISASSEYSKDSPSTSFSLVKIHTRWRLWVGTGGGLVGTKAERARARRQPGCQAWGYSGLSSAWRWLPCTAGKVVLTRVTLSDFPHNCPGCGRRKGRQGMTWSRNTDRRFGCPGAWLSALGKVWPWLWNGPTAPLAFPSLWPCCAGYR